MDGLEPKLDGIRGPHWRSIITKVNGLKEPNWIGSDWTNTEQAAHGQVAEQPNTNRTLNSPVRWVESKVDGLGPK